MNGTYWFTKWVIDSQGSSTGASSNLSIYYIVGWFVIGFILVTFTRFKHLPDDIVERSAFILMWPLLLLLLPGFISSKVQKLLNKDQK